MRLSPIRGSLIVSTGFAVLDCATAFTSLPVTITSTTDNFVGYLLQRRMGRSLPSSNRMRPFDVRFRSSAPRGLDAPIQ